MTTDPSEKIVIHAEELTENRPAPVVVNVLGDLPIRNWKRSHVWLAVVTLIPFLNCWAWWRFPAEKSERRRIQRAISVVLAVASLVVTVTIAVLFFQPKPNWIETAVAAANQGVVKIEVEEKGFWSSSIGMGTGFVVASKGDQHLILTNKHVLGNAQKCSVSGRAFSTPVIGTLVGLARDEEIDLALILVRTKGLRPLGPIAPFETIKTGNRVIAIGHPLGMDYSVTEGIISSKRDGVKLQTSAPINPGNSGGPLIDAKGRVVGVNTLTAYNGLGLAFRADWVMDANHWIIQADISDLLSSITFQQ